MQIELESNRRFIKKICMIFALISVLFIILLLIAFFTGYMTLSQDFETLIFLIIYIIIECICIIILLITKFKPKPSYIFNENEIIVNDKKSISQKFIAVENIEYMHYYPWKFHYIITMFFGALMEGGAMKIHLKEKNGTKHALGFIGLKDAKRLKEIYSDLLTIYYTKWQMGTE